MAAASGRKAPPEPARPFISRSQPNGDLSLTKARLILMVEDNPDDELLTLDALNSAGLDALEIKCEIVVTRDGVEALEYLFAQGAHAGRDPDRDPCLVL